MFEYFKSQFQEHAIKKTYAALVRGLPRRPYGVIDMPIGIMNGTLKRSTRSRKDAKSAVTEYWVRKEFRSADNPDKFALLEVKPKTGRTHQIRVHLASIGHPIMGDALYGGKGRPGFAARPLLHAAKIEFTLARGKTFEFSADLPPDFSLVIHSLLPVT
jgi:23S rRNA pseudouridine1911/1915/1917 synthase